MRLNPRLNAGDFSHALANLGRVQIRDFLDTGEAEKLHNSILTETSWVRSLNKFAGHDDTSGYPAEIALGELEALPKEKKEMFYAFIRQTARENKLQYCYDKIRVSESVANGTLLSECMKGLYDFVLGDDFREFISILTGWTGPRLTDIRAYRYLPGHFIMPHNDSPGEYERVYAWVLNLNPVWRAPWGGLLEFSDDEGLIIETFVPLFNSINVFRVPQMHAVSYVTPFAAEPRYSCTGWISFNRRATTNS